MGQLLDLAGTICGALQRSLVGGEIRWWWFICDGWSKDATGPVRLSDQTVMSSSLQTLRLGWCYFPYILSVRTQLGLMARTVQGFETNVVEQILTFLDTLVSASGLLQPCIHGSSIFQ